MDRTPMLARQPMDSVRYADRTRGLICQLDSSVPIWDRTRGLINQPGTSVRFGRSSILIPMICAEPLRKDLPLLYVCAAAAFSGGRSLQGGHRLYHSHSF